MTRTERHAQPVAAAPAKGVRAAAKKPAAPLTKMKKRAVAKTTSGTSAKSKQRR